MTRNWLIFVTGQSTTCPRWRLAAASRRASPRCAIGQRAETPENRASPAGKQQTLLSISRQVAVGTAVACAAIALPTAALAASGTPTHPAAARPRNALSVRSAQIAAVPTGFQPASASSLTPASGFVLGGVGCKQLPCTARLVATTDGGARWHFVKAPAVRIADGFSAKGVSSVMFASARNGWLYGPELRATHDGGAHWRKLSLGGAIEQMAAAAGKVYAVVSRPGGSSELVASPAGRNDWVRVRHFTGDTLAVSGRAAWFAVADPDPGRSRTTRLWATADGVHWHRHTLRCPGVDLGLTSIAAASRSDVVFLCTGNGAAGSVQKEVLTSSNGGKTIHLAGPAPAEGDPMGIAVPPSRANVITLAAASGASFLDRSANGGKTWVAKTVSGSAGGPFLSSLSYVSRTVGWVVLGEPGLGGPDRLLRTTNAGITWHNVGF
jgi:hypothetical protein